jgi:tetratricopeptide (TPR) repeat protein
MKGKTKLRIAVLAALFACGAVFFINCAGEPQPAPSGIMDRTLSPEAEDLLRTGVAYHDRGDYETALDYYRQAMELAPDHPIIYYEMGFSYISMGDSETALDLAEKGIAAAEKRRMNDVMPTLFDLKGSALDNLNRSEEAITVYLAAISQYGANTFLYYNLGLSYYRIDRQDDAWESLIKGLLINPNHPSSNYLLGKIATETGKKTQAFYSLCYFLLLEPNTERSAQVYNTVLYMLDREDEAIGVRNNGAFTASDMVITFSFSLDEQNAELSDAEKTRAKLYYLFTSLEEQKNSGKIGRSEGDELWWDFYAPFFYRIAQSDYFDVYCRYIGLTTDPKADDWIENGREEIEGFFEWLNVSD